MIVEDGRYGRQDSANDVWRRRMSVVVVKIVDVEAFLELAVSLLDDGAVLGQPTRLGAVVLEVLVVVDRVDAVVLRKESKMIFLEGNIYLS